MAPADIRNLTQRKPFIPFRVATSDGTYYEVRHPDLVMIGMSSVAIGYPSPRDPRNYEKMDIISLQHIVRLEPAEQAVVEA